MALKTEPVSFRITKEEAKKLDQARGDTSRGQHAMELLLAGLDDSGQKAIASQVEQLREEVERNRSAIAGLHGEWKEHAEKLTGELEKLRVDLATTAVAVLVAGAEPVPQEDAEQWARENLGYRKGGKQ